MQTQAVAFVLKGAGAEAGAGAGAAAGIVNRWWGRRLVDDGAAGCVLVGVRVGFEVLVMALICRAKIEQAVVCVCEREKGTPSALFWELRCGWGGAGTRALICYFWFCV